MELEQFNGLLDGIHILFHTAHHVSHCPPDGAIGMTLNNTL
jgi:hypothetical protein